MRTTRRMVMLSAVGAIGLLTLGGFNWRRTRVDSSLAVPGPMAAAVRHANGMVYRRLGKTGLQVSEVGFGSWGIGGMAYGAVSRQDAVDALSRAEELGCNFVDTAQVYGNAETLLGEFMQGRRSKWHIATKYSGQAPSLTAVLDQQLRTMRTDYVDLYQLHWVPRSEGAALYEELRKAKQAGKARAVGVSASTVSAIDYASRQPDIDVIQIPFNLLQPNPFLLSIDNIRKREMGVIVRSSLREGFLTGKYGRSARFTDPNDRRSQLAAKELAATLDQVERFRFLERDAGSMTLAAIAYPLSFPEVSTVVLGTKSSLQSEENFSRAPGRRLTVATMEQIWRIQDAMDLSRQRSPKSIIKRLLGRTDYI